MSTNRCSKGRLTGENPDITWKYKLINIVFGKYLLVIFLLVICLLAI